MRVLDADLSFVTGPLRQNSRHHVGGAMRVLGADLSSVTGPLRGKIGAIRVLDADLSSVTGPLRQNSRHHACSGCRFKLRHGATTSK